METFYEHYEMWEDYLNGMYDIPKKSDEETYVNLAIKMLSDNTMFLDTCKIVVSKWVISSKVNLTNKMFNRRAWLGQACCNYKYKVPELCTRIAWGRLTTIQQDEANKIAELIINSFEINYEKKDRELYKRVGIEML